MKALGTSQIGEMLIVSEKILIVTITKVLNGLLGLKDQDLCELISKGKAQKQCCTSL